MTATQEALAAMAQAEEAFDKMINDVVEASEQFQKDCKEIGIEL